MTDCMHTSDLVERHAISLPAQKEEWLLGVRREAAKHSAWMLCAEYAARWAEEQGFEIQTSPYETLDADGLPARWGVKWIVTVGRGTMGEWSWSSRWQDWLTVFKDLARSRLTLVR